MTGADDTQSRRPEPGEYDPFYQRYLARVAAGPIVPRLAAQGGDLRALLGRLRPDGASYRYEPGKWSIKDVLGHLADSERIFGMRATCIARGETAELPGFEQEEYVSEGDFGARTLDSLLREIEQLRGANVEMFSGLTDDRWDRMGTANGAPISVRALAWILAGHLEHHLVVLREHYADAFGSSSSTGV